MRRRWRPVHPASATEASAPVPPWSRERAARHSLELAPEQDCLRGPARPPRREPSTLTDRTDRQGRIPPGNPEPLGDTARWRAGHPTASASGNTPLPSGPRADEGTLGAVAPPRTSA